MSRSSPPAAPAPAASRAGVARAPIILRAVRPRQWLKNVLVLCVPVAAARLFDGGVLAGTAVAFACFCTAASAVYLVNDVRDIDEDRRHPTKRLRPVAAGLLRPRWAVTIGTVLSAAAVAVAFWWALPLGTVIAVYLLLQAAYTFGLKQQPVLDLAVVSSGFLLRAVAGAAGTGIAISPMLLLVAAFGSLFMVAGKRYSETRRVGADAQTRTSLGRYSASYLRFVWTLSATVTILTYLLWAVRHTAGQAGGLPWGVISVAPFALGMMRYAVAVDGGDAGAPEDIVLADHALQLIGGVWLATALLAVLS